MLLFCLPQSSFAQSDTIPAHGKKWFKKVTSYVDSMMSRRFRDSVLKSISRHDAPLPSTDDSSMIRSEQGFLPYAGKPIRHIRYRKVAVFGPRNINDTAFTTSMKLIHLANRLHFDSQEWMLRQSLFFREKDTVNAYELADNERYLRNRPFLTDARIIVLETKEGDSVDIMVVTKDIFEYGFDLRELTPTAAAARVFSNNLFGAGQALSVGFRWQNEFAARPWGTQASYTKYNLLGSFTDVTVGYSTLNTQIPLDSGVYEGSYFVSANRPLYRTSARVAGGVSFARNFSINVRGFPDSIFRDYAYKQFDVWGGYSFLNRIDRNGDYDKKANLALLFRYNNLAFDKHPSQERFKEDPLYNDRHYYLGQLLLFKQEFFKTNNFFGFGRTEDIPYGYNAAASAGWENWNDRRRFYTALEGQKYWHTRAKGLLSLNAGVGSFWREGVSEDLVIHANVSYYSRLMNLWKGHWRLFLSADYLGNPNNYFYRPLSINYEFGLWPYRDTKISGYHRLNLRSEGVYYSPWKIYGFKFNFFTSVEASQLSHQNQYLVENPIYPAIGLGVRIRNENLALNTLKAAGYWLPGAPPGQRGFFFEVTTVVDLRFDIYGMRAPSFLQFR
ncbi:hypothetical protein ACWKWU_06630 [Chitinophaga lutea]